MKYFLYRLIPPRPTYPADITPAEAELRPKHVAYWTQRVQQGMVLAFGPVADPKGTYGIAILRIDDDADAHAMAAADPVIAAALGFTYELHPMPRVVHVE